MGEPSACGTALPGHSGHDSAYGCDRSTQLDAMAAAPAPAAHPWPQRGHAAQYRQPQILSARSTSSLDALTGRPPRADVMLCGHSASTPDPAAWWPPNERLPEALSRAGSLHAGLPDAATPQPLPSLADPTNAAVAGPAHVRRAHSAMGFREALHTAKRAARDEERGGWGGGVDGDEEERRKRGRLVAGSQVRRPRGGVLGREGTWPAGLRSPLACLLRLSAAAPRPRPSLRR
jgi:hypothetical protein